MLTIERDLSLDDYYNLEKFKTFRSEVRKFFGFVPVADIRFFWNELYLEGKITLYLSKTGKIRLK